MTITYRGLGIKAKPNWKQRCQCPCGCNRRCMLRSCTYCARGAHSLPIAIAAYVERHIGRQDDRSRTKCSVCGKAGEWYEFDPGAGRCTECQP